MSTFFSDKEKAERKRRNKEVAERLKRGDPLTGRPQDTWYPLRPKIKKDENALKIIFKDDNKRLKLVEEEDDNE